MVENLPVLKIVITILPHYVHNTDSCPHNGNIHLVGSSGPNTVEGEWSTVVMECGSHISPTAVARDSGVNCS